MDRESAAKRVLERYFQRLDDPSTRIVPITQTVRLEDDDQSKIDRAWEFMSEAAAGRHPKRVPLAARLERDGTYTILDGKSTHANLERLGVEIVPLVVVNGD
jgi:hypothetical protein